MNALAAAAMFVMLACDAAGAAGIAIPDEQLLDQDSTAVAAGAALSGKSVTVVSFTYTGCRSICPVADLVMSALDRAPGDFRIATLTIDPIGDTPEVLARHAEALGASPRWRFYTGDPEKVLDVVSALGMDPRSLTDHPSFFLVIGPAMHSVTRLEISASSADIRRAVAAAAR